MAAELTPMMRQYLAMKREVPPGAILMFRLGDFYEMFGEDAVSAAPILGATLTHRGDQPMCGVPYHALNTYLAKLIRAGKTAALCDQVEDPKTAKGLVRREITRIVTPGTVTEDGLLDETANNYVAATSNLGLALLDLSTGEFAVEQFATSEKLTEALARYRPAERLTPTDENRWTFSPDAALDCLTRHFKVLSLDGFGLTGKIDLISAAGALLYYVGTTLHHSLEHIRKVQIRESDDGLVLDAGTVRHLQLLPGGEVAKDASLLGVLDVTKTPMGARTMRNWILRPLARATDINLRLDAVERFVNDRVSLADLRRLLTGVRDLERLIAKVDAGRANPRDLKGLAASLRPIPEIRRVLHAPPPALVSQPEIIDLIDRSISEDPPVLLADGGFVAAGYDAELDELRQIATEGHQWLAEFQLREQQRTGISKLKVKHVSTFGFVIEIPKGSIALVPTDYERRQTLTTGERYVTPELKEYERKVMGAQEKAIAIEQRLYKEILAKISAKTVEIQDASLALGELDATLALADRALAAGYVRPVVDDSDVLEIQDGRHPIIEQLLDAEPFVPNSAFLNTTTDQIMLITGPNMAGKSTYIRQVATIAVMAQMGSFVPASAMRLGVLDRIFTRIGAGDDLARGRSTFLVEMQETANILNNATPKSLIVLDEIGRGTSTFDGISIAWSVAEYLHGKPETKAKTLFATHYHELTDLADVFAGVKNYTVRVKDEGGRVVFLRRITPGVAEKSFGIHVGAMAGLPAEVVRRAEIILKNLESNEIDVQAREKAVKRPRRKLSELPGQMTFFSLLFLGLRLFAADLTLPVTTVKEVTDHRASTYPGRVVSIAEVAVTPQVSGEILEVSFLNGQHVKAGDVLYRIDPVKYKAAVKNAESKLAECRANAQYAELSYDRHRNLLETRAVSLDAVDNALSQRDSSRAALAAAEADLVAAQDALKHCTIIAPIEGKVGSTMKTKGNYVKAEGDSLVTIVQRRPVRVRFSISNRELLQIFTEGGRSRPDDVSVSLGLADGTTYSEHGRVEYADNVADEKTDTVMLYVVFPNEDLRLVVGGTVRVEVSSKRGVKRPAIPPTAVLQDTQGPYVWVLDERGVASRRTVARGEAVNDWLFVEKGLKVGERIVADGAHKVRRGMTIEAAE